MLLIISQSNDATAEILLDRIDARGESYFRLNFDYWPEYEIRLTPEDFFLRDKMGRELSLKTTAKAYYRKPAKVLVGSKYPPPAVDEMWECLRTLVRLLWRHCKLVLVEPYCESCRLDKFTQLALASSFFPVPTTSFVSGTTALNHSSHAVVKSLVGEWSADKCFFTTPIKVEDLDLSYTWFIQDLVTAAFDVTVVYVRGKQFAFSLRRDFVSRSPDWRSEEVSLENPRELYWEFIKGHKKFEDRVEGFMSSALLSFGRLDFLWDGGEEFTFCEVNPNGQFAWLDLEDREGVLSSVVNEISPQTPIYPIRYNPFKPLKSAVTSAKSNF